MARRPIRKIILHCSATDKASQDSEQMIRLLHTLPPEFKIDWGEYKNTPCRGWKDIGYHSVILKSGKIMAGRTIFQEGAHCKGHNKDSIGICLSGNKHFTDAQFRALVHMVYALCCELGLEPLEHVYTHSHFDENKTCPNFDWKEIWHKYGGIIYDSRSQKGV